MKPSKDMLAIDWTKFEGIPAHRRVFVAQMRQKLFDDGVGEFSAREVWNATLKADAEQEAASNASRDPDFQRFLDLATSKPKTYSKRLNHAQRHWQAVSQLDHMAKAKKSV